MEKFAVVKIKNAQFKVTEGDIIEVDRFTGEVGDKVKLEEVLLLVNKEQIEIGKPLLEKVVVNAEIMEHFRGKKVDSLVFKAKARHRKRSGDRKELTKLKIVKIS